MTRRVLVVRLDGAGDVLLAGPAVRAVAAAAEVTLLCGPAGAAAGAILPGVNRVLGVGRAVGDHPRARRSAATTSQTVVDEIGRGGFAEAVVLTSFHQSPLPTALLLRLAGIQRIIGASVDHPGSLLDVRLRPGNDASDDLPEDLPEPERALRIAAAAGFPLPAGDDGRLAVRVPPLLTPPADPPYVVLHPGAAVTARRWPAGHFRRTAELLAGHGLGVVVTGGPGERELTAEVAGRIGVDLGGRTGFAELAAVLAAAGAVVVGNTAAAHLAAAVDTPVVSLFAPVVPAVRWRPYRVPQVLLGDQTAPCRDTRARECPVPGHPCLSQVQPRGRGGRGPATDRPGSAVAAAGGAGMNVLLWHVHGSWATAFVQGRHRYLIPTLPERGPWGGGRPAAWDWPADRRRGGPGPAARRAGRRGGAAAAGGAGAGRGLAGPGARARRGRGVRRAQRPARARGHQPAPDGRPRRADAGARHALQRGDVGRRRHPHRRDRARHRRPRPPLHRRAGPGGGGHQRAAAPQPDHRHRSAARVRRVPRRWTCSGWAPPGWPTTSAPACTAAATCPSTGCTRRWPGAGPTCTRCAGRRWGCRCWRRCSWACPWSRWPPPRPSAAVPPEAGVCSADPDRLAGALRELVAEPELARRRGAAAREFALAHYGLGRFLDDWDRLLDDVQNRPPTAGRGPPRPLGGDGCDGDQSDAASTPRAFTSSRNTRARSPNRAGPTRAGRTCTCASWPPRWPRPATT